MFKKCFLLVALLLISAVGFADTSGLSGQTSSAVADHTDLSMTYLSMVFGSVGDSFHGISGQMLGMLFKQFNTGILAALGILLSYTTVLTTMRITSEGMASGQNRNVHLMALRICAGFAAVVPNPNTGYNFAQVGLAAIVVQSVKLANSVWGIGLNYIQQGGTVWSDPSNALNKGQDAIKKSLGPSSSSSINDYYSSDQGALVRIFGNLYCMYSNYGEQLKNKKSGIASPTVPTFADKTTCKNSSISDINVCENTLYFQKPGNINPPVTIGGIKTGGCGTIDATKVFAGAGGSETLKQYARLGVQSAVNSLASAAKAAYCSQAQSSGTSLCPSKVDSDEASSQVNSAFAGSYLGFLGAALPIQRASASGAKKGVTDFVKDAKAKGWAMAGRYYWNMTQVSTLLSKASDLGSVFAGSSAAVIGSMDNSAKPIYGLNGAGVLTAITNATTANTTGSVDPDKVQNTGYEEAGSYASGIIATALSVLSPVFAFLGALFSLIIGFAQATQSNIDPVMIIYQLGMEMFNAAGILIQGGIIAASVWGAANTAMACGNLQLGSIYKYVQDWLGPLCLFAAFSLTGCGVMLSYYTPLYPFIIYTFAVMGWLTVVIEAMVAMPLVALGLTHPEGHDFLGKAEQAMMLALGVFLRPALMVIGLITAMILAFVGLKILNVGLAGVMGSIFHGTGKVHLQKNMADAASSVTRAMVTYKSNNVGAMILKGMVTIPFFYVLYTSLIYQLISQSYRMVHVLPDYVMKWIGAPSQPSGAFQPDQVAAGVKQGASSAVSSASQLGSRAVDGNRAVKNHRESMAKGKTGGGGGGDKSGDATIGPTDL